MRTQPSWTQFADGIAPRMVWIAGLVLLVPLLLDARKLYDDDPLEAMPPPMRVEDAAARKLSDYFDFFHNSFALPGEHHPEPVKKGEQPPPIPAQATNTIGEVPDNSWFTNRIGSRPYSIEDLLRGPGSSHAPAEGRWTIIAAKTEGVTPGFTIQDTKGQRYLLKFDPLSNPEMATAADAIGSIMFHALGYNTPENYIVFFDRERLDIREGTMIPGSDGKPRPMDQSDIRDILKRVPKAPDGRYRGLASYFLKGKLLREFRYYGTRKDDPNDIVAHEHRRDLRGLFVLCAWLGHDDSRSINTLDTLVEEGNLKYIRHNLIDFGSILGSASEKANSARSGNAYLYQFKPAVVQIFTLGMLVPKWARVDYPKLPAVGIFDYRMFDPEEWKPEYPNPAFLNRLPDDTYWAAKKVMSFSDEHIRAAIKHGQYSNPAAEDWIVKCLNERRDRIGRKYFSWVLPIDNFKVEGGRLAFENLAVKHGFAEQPAYKVQWSTFNNEQESHAPISGAASFDIPAAANSGANGSYYAARIEADSPEKTVTVYLRKNAGGFKLVGIDRTYPWPVEKD